MEENVSDNDIQQGIDGAFDIEDLLKMLETEIEKEGAKIDDTDNELPKRAIIDTDQITQKNTPSSSILTSDKSKFNAFELFHSDIEEIPKLLDPFLQTVGLASLVGTSDCGKSTFLRQLSLSIVLNLNSFIGFKLNCKYNKVIYVSTEDDPISLASSVKKQINHLQKKHQLDNLDGLKNLEVIFDSTGLYLQLTEMLEKAKYDLVIIDAFTDVFKNEINSNTHVRTFLSAYDKLAKKHNCLILFLHHISKGKDRTKPSKDSVIGSQGFEAKMRILFELRPDLNNKKQVNLWVLKANFLDSKFKSKGHNLNFNSELIFENTGELRYKEGNKTSIAKIDNKELHNKILELDKKGLSYRKIEEELKDTKFKVSKSVIGEIIKKNKK